MSGTDRNNKLKCYLGTAENNGGVHACGEDGMTGNEVRRVS